MFWSDGGNPHFFPQGGEGPHALQDRAKILVLIGQNESLEVSEIGPCLQQVEQSEHHYYVVLARVGTATRAG